MNSMRDRRAYVERNFEMDFPPMPERISGRPMDPLTLKLMIVPIVYVIAMFISFGR